MPLVVAHNVRQSMVQGDREINRRFEKVEKDKEPKRLASTVAPEGKGKGLRSSLKRSLSTFFSAPRERVLRPNQIFEDRVFLPNSNTKLAWDVIGCMLIVYSVISVTTRLGFDLEVELNGNDSIVDYCIDFVFMLDILVNFITGYYDDDMNLITDRNKIAKRYLKLWFWIDLGSTIPFDVIVELASGQDGENLRALKLIRFFRLLKLGRLRKLSHAVRNLEDMTGIHPTIMELMRLIMKILFASHFIACGWNYVACSSDDGIYHRIGLEQGHYMTRYVMSLNWAIATMTGVGYGDVHATTINERVYAIFIQIIGASIFGFLLGNINTILDSINIRSSFRRTKMNQVKHYISQMEFPKDLKVKVKRHFRYYCQKKEIFEAESALSSLSSSLYKEVVLQTFHELRLKFTLFTENSPEFLMGCVTAMLPVAYQAGEEIKLVGDANLEIHFLFEGIVHICGKRAWMNMGETGDFFGALDAFERTDTISAGKTRSKLESKDLYDNNIIDRMEEGTVIGVYTDGSLLSTQVLSEDKIEQFTTQAASFCDCYILEKEKFKQILTYAGAEGLLESLVEVGVNRTKKLGDCLQLPSKVMRYSTEGEITLCKMSTQVLVNDTLTELPDLANSGYKLADPSGDRRVRKQSIFDQFQRGFRQSIIRKSNVVHPESPAGLTIRNRNRKAVKEEFPGEKEKSTAEKIALIISPNVINHEGLFKVRWEMVLCILILYSALTVPYLLCFDDEAKYLSAFWVLELCVDIFFVTDLVLNFFTSYHDYNSLGKSRVRDLYKIIYHYGTSKWFVIDFLSSVPFDRILALYFSSAADLKILRLIRMLRLARLIKLFKKSAYLEDLDDEYPTLMQAGKLLIQVSFSAHFLACAWYLVSEKGKTSCTDESIRNGTYNEHYCNWAKLESEFSSGEDKIRIYLASLYWAYTTMTTVGYGDIVPGSDSEAVMAVFSMIFGVTMFAYVVGSMAVVVATLNATTRRVKQKIDDMDMFLREKDIEASLHKRVKDYYAYYLRNLYAFDEKYLLDEMPWHLRKECLYVTYGRQLKSIPFFSDFDQSAVSLLAPMIKNQQFEEGEVIFSKGEVGTHIFFIEKGSVQVLIEENNKQKKTNLHHGHYFGEVSTFFKVRRTATVTALENLKTFSVEASNFKAALRTLHLNKDNVNVDGILESMLNEIMQMHFDTQVRKAIKSVKVPGRSVVDTMLELEGQEEESSLIDELIIEEEEEVEEEKQEEEALHGINEAIAEGDEEDEE